jgi:hypothetical protein
MSVWLIAEPQNRTLSDELTPETILAKLQALFKNPRVEPVDREWAQGRSYSRTGTSMPFDEGGGLIGRTLPQND